jgi:glycosyltransferase involved in cell wall biosynthesis
MVLPDLQVGGTQVYAARAARSLRSYEVTVEICALIPRGPLRSDLIRDGIPIHGTSFAGWTRRARSWVVLRVIQELREVISSGKFDAVHTYLFWPDVVGAWAARSAGCRRIILSRRALHAWRHARTPLAHQIELATNAIAHELIANSRTVLDDAERCERFLPKHRTVIYNGVDIACYVSATPGLAGRLELITVGALSARKGQQYAIRALRLLVDGGIDARLTLVGGGEDEQSLRRVARAEGVENGVVFAGEQADPKPFLRQSDLFVLPSRQEGFSNALLEAMASALPVVATDVGGNSEALDPLGGRIVPANDPPAMAQAIAELHSDREIMRAMGLHNRERVRAVFSLEASVRGLARWYRDGPA